MISTAGDASVNVEAEEGDTLQTDNSIADGVLSRKVQLKQTKTMDMGFHWLRNREYHEHIRLYW